MALDMEVILFAAPLLVKGLGWTIGISLSSIVLGIVLGLMLCLAQLAKNRLANLTAKLYIAIFRGTPFLVQLFIIYYVLPAAGINIPALGAGILALGLYAGAYMAEIFRAGIDSVPKGQSESARALGMPYYIVLRRIVIPQAAGLVLPPLTSLCMTTVKDSSMLSIITVTELTMTGNIIIGITFSPVEVYLLTASMYWALNSLLAFLAQKWEYRILANR